jgi:hypothetical protein
VSSPASALLSRVAINIAITTLCTVVATASGAAAATSSPLTLSSGRAVQLRTCRHPC